MKKTIQYIMRTFSMGQWISNWNIKPGAIQKTVLRFRGMRNLGGAKTVHEAAEDEAYLYKHRLKQGAEVKGPSLTFKRNLFGQVLVSVLVGLMLVLPAARVYAAAYVTLDSFSGHPTTIHVSGGGFAPGESVSVHLNTATGIPAATAVAGLDGSFGPVAVNIPPSTPEGPLPILVVGSQSQQAQSNSYYVVHFSAELTSPGTPNTSGSTSTASGSGYAPGESVTLSINGSAVGTAQADSAGSFTGAAFVVPDLPMGTYQLHGFGNSSGADGIYYFYIGGFFPSLAPSTYYVLPTQTLSFSGSGFGAGETLRLSMGQTELSTFTADSSGGFTDAGGFTVPMSYGGGDKTFTVTGTKTSGSASVQVTIGSFNPNVFPSSYYVLPGESLNFSGGAFAPSETVEVYEGQGTTPVASFTTTLDGTYTNTGAVTIPVTAVPGAATFRLRGKLSGGEVSATVTIGQFNSLVTPSLYHIKAGDSLTFSGTGFASGESVDVFDGQDTTPLATITADVSGSFVNTGTTTIPFSYANSARTMRLVGRSSKTEAHVTITVAAFEPQAGPSLYYVLPGAKIFFYGGGFGAGEDVIVTRDQDSTPLLTIPANADGAFAESDTITIPLDSPSGKATFHLTGAQSSARADVAISIGALNAQISPSAYYVSPGQEFTVSGMGFAGGEVVSMAVSGGTKMSTTTDATGNFGDMGPFIAPLKGTGVHITATGQSSKVSAAVDISLGQLFPQVAPSSYYLPAGSDIAFSGSGFAPGEGVVITSGQSALASTTTDNLGSFPETIVATDFNDTDTQMTFTFTGQDSGASASVTVTLAALQVYISSDSYYATPGSNIRISGSGFAAGETVTLTAGTFSADTTASASGSIDSVLVTLPLSSSGPSVQVAATGNRSHAGSSIPIALAPFMPQVTPSAWYTGPGTAVTFTGSGFAAGESVSISLNNSLAGTASTTPTGEFTTGDMVIPVTTTQTAHFTFTGSKSGAVAGVEIGLSPFSPQITPSAYYVLPGAQVTISGSGYVAGESVEITLNQQKAATATVDMQGGFASSAIQIPYNTALAHFTITSSQSNNTQALDITVGSLQPGLQLSTYYNNGGAPLAVTGMGFGGNESVDITFDGKPLATVTTDSSGNFTASSTVPFGTEGNKTVQATGKNSGAKVSAAFVQAPVYMNVQLSAYAGAPGDAVTFVGSGYLPSEPVNITTDRTGGTVVHTFAADSTGSFNDSGYAPPISFTGGPLTLTITGAHSLTAKSIIYYVTGP